MKRYVFVPWLAFTGIAPCKTSMWSEDPVIALADACEGARMILFKHFGDPHVFQDLVIKSQDLPNAARIHKHMSMAIEAQRARGIPVGHTHMSKAQAIDWDTRVMSNVFSRSQEEEDDD